MLTTAINILFVLLYFSRLAFQSAALITFWSTEQCYFVGTQSLETYHERNTMGRWRQQHSVQSRRLTQQSNNLLSDAYCHVPSAASVIGNSPAPGRLQQSPVAWQK